MDSPLSGRKFTPCPSGLAYRNLSPASAGVSFERPINCAPQIVCQFDRNHSLVVRPTPSPG